MSKRNTLLTELDKELELDKEKDIEIIKEVVAYLNEKIDSNYKHTSSKTQDLIKARLNQKHTLEEFKIVIDKKSHEWLKDEKMCKFLRPETLFGTKFESYLNQVSNVKTREQLNKESEEQYGF